MWSVSVWVRNVFKMKSYPEDIVQAGVSEKKHSSLILLQGDAVNPDKISW
jgi:hypothetical protein